MQEVGIRGGQQQARVRLRNRAPAKTVDKGKGKTSDQLCAQEEGVKRDHQRLKPIRRGSRKMGIPSDNTEADPVDRCTASQGEKLKRIPGGLSSG